MNTALVLAALTVSLGAAPTTPTWTGNYAQAQERAAGKKPMAVVFGSGQDGWTKLIRSEDAKKILAEQYECVYVDTNDAAGKKLASAFAINNPTGVVLSDRAGSVQAYWHDGDLADATLVRSLRKYSDPTVSVVTTERESVVRVSNYPAGSVITTSGVLQGSVITNGVIQGGYIQQGTVIQSSCPNGRCPYAR